MRFKTFFFSLTSIKTKYWRFHLCQLLEKKKVYRRERKGTRDEHELCAIFSSTCARPAPSVFNNFQGKTLYYTLVVGCVYALRAVRDNCSLCYPPQNSRFHSLYTRKMRPPARPMNSRIPNPLILRL